ncbi:MAG: hypothetical protein HY096_09840 [Nitrospinae bacterium]|nr:hypothetical protein [Nitrospinota bacterium]
MQFVLSIKSGIRMSATDAGDMGGEEMFLTWLAVGIIIGVVIGAVGIMLMAEESDYKKGGDGGYDGFAV